jgi:hypothetical protein
MDKDQVSAAPADREAWMKVVKEAEALITEFEYATLAMTIPAAANLDRVRRARAALLAHLRTAAPAAVPLQPCRAEPRGRGEWVCDCKEPRTNCKPAASPPPPGESAGSAPAEPAPAPAMVMLTPVLDEVSRATRKFPTWPTDPLHAVAVLGEEFGELTKAMLQLTYEPHKTSADEVRTEAIQTAAMALRLLASLDRYRYAPCHQHSQHEPPPKTGGSEGDQYVGLTLAELDQQIAANHSGVALDRKASGETGNSDA